MTKTKTVIIKDGKRIVVDADYEQKEVPQWFKEILKEDDNDTKQRTINEVE
jgi:hypothetical protein